MESFATCFAHVTMFSESSSPWMKRGGILDKPTDAPTSAPTKLDRTQFCPPPLTLHSKALSKLSKLWATQK